MWFSSNLHWNTQRHEIKMGKAARVPEHVSVIFELELPFFAKMHDLLILKKFKMDFPLSLCNCEGKWTFAIRNGKLAESEKNCHKYKFSSSKSNKNSLIYFIATVFYPLWHVFLIIIYENFSILMFLCAWTFSFGRVWLNFVRNLLS